MAGRTAERSDEIVGTYDPDGTLPDLLDAQLPARRFLPSRSSLRSSRQSGEICVVVPVRTAARDWGLLAVVGDVDATSAREPYQHWAALLCAALESQRLQQEVSRSALYDALTGLPNRRLFLERLNVAIARRDRSGTPSPSCSSTSTGSSWSTTPSGTRSATVC